VLRLGVRTSKIPEIQLFWNTDQQCYVQKSSDRPEHGPFLAVLKQIRKDAGMTQDDLAERLDTSQSRITDYERGVRRLDMVELRQICEAVGTTLPEFVRRFEEMVIEMRAGEKSGG
jgi:DNA-binding transcriptional regulator YiaG